MAAPDMQPPTETGSQMQHDRRSVLRLIALSTTSLVAFSCAPPPPPPGTIVLNRGNSSDIKSLDPAFIDGSWEFNVVGEVLIGLTTEGPDAKPVPGAATHWETSDDGLTWTFHLRDHTWSDGVKVTAHDFVAAWRREVDPNTGAIYAYNLWVVKNAKKISTGKLPPETLGIEALDDMTLKVTLEHPAPYLPQLMAHPVAYPIPHHIYERLGAAWSHPQNYVANGPYMPKLWVPLDRVIVTKNKRFYDAANVQIDEVIFYVTNDTEAALKRYRAGELDVQFGYPAIEIDWMRANIPDQIKSVPYLETTFLDINFGRPLFKDRRLREVLNLAVDRETIVNKIRRLGETPAYAVVPPGISNYPHTAQSPVKSLSQADRIAKARQLMGEMGYGPNKRLKINFLTATSPDWVRIAAALLGMYQSVWIDLNIRAEERQVQIVDLNQHNFDLAYDGWIADFDDASNFLDLLITGSGENNSDYSNPAFDALINTAQQRADPKIRAQLLSQAEQMALDDYCWVPLYNSVTEDLVKPYVTGWIPNAKDINRNRWLRMERKPGAKLAGL